MIARVAASAPWVARAVLTCACLGATMLGSCSSDPTQGYSFTAARSDSVHSVAVPVFENHSYQHGLEQQLTEAIIKEIQRHTGWVVTSSGRAQTTLTGTIAEVQLRSLTTSANTGLVLEQAYEMTVNFEWKDSSGKTLVARKSFKAMETFVPALGTSERLELGEHAAVQEMARAIVNELRSTW
jgi:hypothetical protein